MKKYIIIVFSLFALSGVQCLKGTNNVCSNKSPASEAGQIQSYAATNGISAIAHSSGIYYQIINPGSGITPSLTSTVYVRYTGKLLDGTIFDTQIGAPLALKMGTLIQGWQIGLPLIQKGGSIKLIIPSSLAYGCQGSGPIPGNSIVYFEIDLVDVQ